MYVRIRLCAYNTRGWLVGLYHKHNFTIMLLRVFNGFLTEKGLISSQATSPPVSFQRILERKGLDLFFYMPGVACKGRGQKGGNHGCRASCGRRGELVVNCTQLETRATHG